MIRPPSITLIGWLLVLTGSVVLVRAGRDVMGPGAARLSEAGPAVASGLLAATGGTFTLLGRDWARWVLVVWMAGHLVLSLAHSVEQTLVHVALFTPISWSCSWRPSATAYFRGSA